MAKVLRFTILAGLVAFVAGCAAQEEEVVVVPEPIQAEPVSGKF